MKKTTGSPTRYDQLLEGILIVPFNYHLLYGLYGHICTCERLQTQLVTNSEEQ